MEISNVNERLEELEAEANFIKELKLDEGNVYVIDGKR